MAEVTILVFRNKHMDHTESQELKKNRDTTRKWAVGRIMEICRGQIPLPIIISIGGVIMSVITGYYSGQLSNQAAVATVSERTAVLETSVPRLEDDVREVKGDVKLLLQRFGIESKAPEK